ncbi:peptide chain release factor N(5)-glutamine methyltransferase [Limnohabitans sp. 2KL-27]|uniref:peptide chain release factor N(5)-glutamine methyltransferase n=1 Tax=Limnohabitans sp. 2KL-27 TaxID=1100705 RepID=UPI000ADAFB9C|nr:peptide chain release factor N(5)-glutamine methyltransferase [Limnohabitans sp. 2KL-27]
MRTAATVAQCLRQAHTLGLARVDAQMLLLHGLQRPLHERAWLMAHDGDALTTEQETTWQNALQRRLQGEPVAYITGRKDFFGLTLGVDARVLDPRPDTEILVEWALELLPTASEHTLRVLDLGTGSGAVALALQHQRPAAQVTAVDASADALAVALANTQGLNLPVQCVLSHWMDAVPGPFELIVSNPPYVAEGDPHLAALTHEPLSALTSGADGLDDIRQIIAQAPSRLAPGGWLLLEHGWDQAVAVQALLSTAGFVQVQSRRDLGGIERCTGAVMPS